MLNGKNIKILELLFQENYRMEDLANFLNLNPRTIRYNIKEINTILKHYNLQEIKKDKDTLYLDKKEIYKIKRLISSHSTLTSIDRRDYLLTKLLLNHEIILTHESKTLDVTRRTLNNDLIEVKKFLKEYHLNVIAIPGKGVKISGKSERINALLIAFFTKFLSVGVNLKTIFKNILFSLVEEKKLEDILLKTNIFLEKIEKNLQSFSFYAVISIVILSFTSKENKKFLYNIENINTEEYKNIKNFFKNELDIFLPDEYIYVIIEILNKTYISNFEIKLKQNAISFFDELDKTIFKDSKLDLELKEKIFSLIKIADYKSRLNITEKNIKVSDLPKYNLDIFYTLQELLPKYFRSFEIEDIILLTRFIQAEIQDQNKNRKKVVVIDNTLNQFAGKRIGNFLKNIYGFEIINYIPLYRLKYFLTQEKNIDMIISLVNLDFEIENIPVYEIEFKKFWKNFKLLDE